MTLGALRRQVPGSWICTSDALGLADSLETLQGWSQGLGNTPCAHLARLAFRYALFLRRYDVPHELIKEVLVEMPAREPQTDFTLEPTQGVGVKGGGAGPMKRVFFA